MKSQITKGSNWQIGKIIIGNLWIITLSIRNESRFCKILFDIHHRVWEQLAIELDEYVFIAITIIYIEAHAQLMVMVKLWRKVGSVNESIVMLIYWIINSKRFFINTPLVFQHQNISFLCACRHIALWVAIGIELWQCWYCYNLHACVHLLWSVMVYRGQIIPILTPTIYGHHSSSSSCCMWSLKRWE